MDFKKDTKENSNGHLDIHNQGQFITQKNATVSVIKDINDFDEINHEISYVFLCKKAEKLTTALYLVTGFLSDNEPIKWGIREAGVTLLTDMSSLDTMSLSNRYQCIKKISSDIERVISLLEISAIAGFVSQMNLTVLKEEYLSLAQSLGTAKKRSLEESFVFGRDFFSTRGYSPDSPALEKKTETFYKGQVKDNVSDIAVASRQEISPIPSLVEKNISGKFYEKDSVSAEMGINDFAKKKQEKGTRRELILALVREKGELSIKDITAHFFDCGEKTIQRELAALVSNNVLKKTGDRRWSRYSLS